MGNSTSDARDTDARRGMQRALHRQFSSDRATDVYASLSAHVTDAATGGAIFWLGVSCAQLAQRALHIGAATPVLPRVVGASAVAASAVLALHFASLPREMWLATTRAASWRELQQRLVARCETLHDAPWSVYALMGLGCFRILGGRWSALAPSNYAHLGAFHLKKASLPATAEYATTTERGIIQELGRLFGCHTCGVRRGVRFNADHAPPKIVAHRHDQRWLRRLLNRKTTFRFYPQCESCSTHQASVVKTGRSALKTHLLAPRLYHTTGLWLVLLCTGGLYAGGSAFQDQTDVISKEALLRSLREREHELQRQRIQANSGIALDAIDHELDAIEDCKAAVKDSSRR